MFAQKMAMPVYTVVRLSLVSYMKRLEDEAEIRICVIMVIRLMPSHIRTQQWH